MSAPPASPSSPPSRWSHPWLAGAALLLAVALAYANSLRAPFLFDDADAVVRNPTIKHLWSLAPLRPPADGSTTTGRPLVNLTYALNYAVSGENPWSYHALNLALHACAALVLFGLLRRTLQNDSPLERGGAERRGVFARAHATSIAFASALLWSLHPLLTEAVVCVAQRTELLCGLLYLFALYAFVRGIESPRWLGLSAAACLGGMAAKEVMATAPLVVLLYDRTFVAGKFSAALRARPRYYAALAATWLLLAWLVLRGGGARGAAAGFGLGVSPWHYLLTQCDALVRYLRLALWPHPLVLDYGTAVVGSLADVWWQAPVVLALLGTTGWALVRRPVLAFAGAWFFLILAPSSSFVPLVTQTIAEHRMYLPLAAVATLAALAAHALLRRAAPAVVCLLSLALGATTFLRNRDYRSELVIWEDNVIHRPHARSLTALGVALVHAGRPAEALPLFTRALALDPAHLSAQRNRALALLQLGRADEAATILAALPAREPGEAEEFFALGNAFAREQKFAEAAAAYARTLALEPTHAGAHANLGNILLLRGRAREAIAHYEAVLRLHPDDARARENLRLAREALR